MTRSGGSATIPPSSFALHAPAATITRRAPSTPSGVRTRTWSSPRMSISVTASGLRTSAPCPRAAAMKAATAWSAAIRPARSGWCNTGPSKRIPGHSNAARSGSSQACGTSWAASVAAISATEAGSPWSTPPVVVSSAAPVSASSSRHSGSASAARRRYRAEP